MTLNDYLSKTGLKIAQFARIIGAAQPTVSRYVNGHRKPCARHLAAIERATGGKVTARSFFMSDAQ